MVVRDECGSGHESSGEVFEVGAGVTEWKVGDRVAIEAGVSPSEAWQKLGSFADLFLQVPCEQCEFCRVGRYNACPDVVFFSTPPYHGEPFPSLTRNTTQYSQAPSFVSLASQPSSLH